MEHGTRPLLPFRRRTRSGRKSAPWPRRDVSKHQPKVARHHVLPHAAWKSLTQKLWHDVCCCRPGWSRLRKQRRTTVCYIVSSFVRLPFTPAKPKGSRNAKPQGGVRKGRHRDDTTTTENSLAPFLAWPKPPLHTHAHRCLCPTPRTSKQRQHGSAQRAPQQEPSSHPPQGQQQQQAGQQQTAQVGSDRQQRTQLRKGTHHLLRLLLTVTHPVDRSRSSSPDSSPDRSKRQAQRQNSKRWVGGCGGEPQSGLCGPDGHPSVLP